MPYEVQRRVSDFLRHLAASDLFGFRKITVQHFRKQAGCNVTRLLRRAETLSLHSSAAMADWGEDPEVLATASFPSRLARSASRAVRFHLDKSVLHVKKRCATALCRKFRSSEVIHMRDSLSSRTADVVTRRMPTFMVQKRVEHLYRFSVANSAERKYL